MPVGAKRPSECALGGKSLTSHRDRDGASEFRVKFDSSDSARARARRARALALAVTVSESGSGSLAGSLAESIRCVSIGATVQTSL